MISLIEALRFRCLQDVSQRLESFQILVGPNASGKSTLLAVPEILGDLLRNGLGAIQARSPSFKNLLWMEEGNSFELAVELVLPEERRARLPNGYERARYEVAIGLDEKGELSILGETLWLKPEAAQEGPRQLELFPSVAPPRSRILRPEGSHTPPGWRKVVSKQVQAKNDYFHAETSKWHNPFRLGPRKLALANLPEDEEKFPAATWVKRTLMEGIQRLALNSAAMQAPSPPGSPRSFQPDGSNLPWVIEYLERSRPERKKEWLAHVRTAFPDIEDVETIEREEDKHRYLSVRYWTGHKAPSWTVSDGTLRLLALTLVAYIDAPGQVFLIEEPENGIHPLAIECVIQALSSAYESQILCASHSPVVLSLADPQRLLCFAKTEEGATAIVSGDKHPVLKEWKRGVNLGTLFASGVL